MSRKVYYLKTADRQSLFLSLEQVGLSHRVYDPDDPNNQRPSDDSSEDWEPTGEYEWVAHDKVILDIIGTIREETGNILTDEDGVEYPETVPIDGFHANLLAPSEYTGDLPEVEVPPATPHRIFAGQV